MNIISLTGCSGSGKNYLAEKLIEQLNQQGFDSELIVSYTTRNIRNGEVDGKDYHFVDKDTFEKRIAENGFIEYVNVNGNYYGTGKEQSNKLFVHIVDPQGVDNLKAKEDLNLYSIFLKDFSDGEMLHSRLKKRLRNASSEKEYEQTLDRIDHLNETEIPQWNNGDLSRYDSIKNIEILETHFAETVDNIIQEVKNHFQLNQQVNFSFGR